MRRIRTELYYLRLFMSRFGAIAGAKAYYLSRLQKETGRIFQLKVPQCRTPIQLRGGTSDIQSFKHLFFRNHYKIPSELEARFIIDAGANIGCASLFFANLFPEAKIVAIEPEDSNFAMLRANTSDYDRIVPLRAGLWSKSGSLGVQASAGKWGAQVHEVESGNVVAITVNDLMNAHGVTTIDILKLNIEGAELEILEPCPSWLGQSRLLIVYFHSEDRMFEIIRSLEDRFGFELIARIERMAQLYRA